MSKKIMVSPQWTHTEREKVANAIKTQRQGKDDKRLWLLKDASFQFLEERREEFADLIEV